MTFSPSASCSSEQDRVLRSWMAFLFVQPACPSVSGVRGFSTVGVFDSEPEQAWMDNVLFVVIGVGEEGVELAPFVLDYDDHLESHLPTAVITSSSPVLSLP
jgi:hypothetical protein